MAIELLNIDCMEYMVSLPDKAFDLAIVDPPYGIDRNGMNMGNSVFNTDDKKWDSEIPSPAYFNELFRVSKNQIIWGGVIIFHFLIVNISLYGIKVKLCMEEILQNASMHG